MPAPLLPLLAVLVLVLLVAVLLLLPAVVATVGSYQTPSCRALTESLSNQSLHLWCRRTLAPRLRGKETTTVTLDIQVKTLYGLGEDEVAEWSGWLTVTWIDPRLAWNSTQTGVQRLQLPRDRLWVPDVGFWNTKETELMDLRNYKATDAVVYSDGLVYLYLYTVIKFPCPLDMKLFPFDRQVCTLEAGPITSDSSEFEFRVRSEMLLGDNASSFAIGEWTLEALTQDEAKVYYTSQYFAKYNVHFHLKRKTMYYAILVLVPFELLSLLASIMFFAQDQGDRASVSIAIIMSMTLYVLIASQTAPKSMLLIPLIGLFLITQMCILIVFTFAAILQNSGSEEEAERTGTKVERLLRRLWRMLWRRWNIVCFCCYLLASATNAVYYLWLWPLTAAAAGHVRNGTHP